MIWPAFVFTFYFQYKHSHIHLQQHCSYIEIKNKVYRFLVGDRSNPQWQQIHAMLESFIAKMKEDGYFPATNYVMQNVEEEEK